MQGKSLADVNSGVTGEGQLIIAMITSFVNSGGTYPIYGFLITPREV